MNELELLKTSLTYLDNLACGFDPFTGEELGESILKNDKLSHCFFFVCGVLERAIEMETKAAEGNPPNSKSETTPEPRKPNSVPRARSEVRATFSFPKAVLASVPLSEAPLKISEFCANLGSALGVTIPATTLTTWLLERGFLEIQLGDNGEKHRLPTAKGTDLGIFAEERVSELGTHYKVVFYDAKAQRLLAEHLNEMPAPKSLKAYSKSAKLERFSLTAEQLAAIQISETGVLISEFCQKVNELLSQKKMEKLQKSAVTNWLVKHGFLENQLDENGKRHRLPTAKGTELGLYTSTLTSAHGVPFTAVFYNAEAQKFLLEHLPEIAGGEA